MDSLRFLVQHVARAFYEPKFIILMDQLARNPVLKDDDLASRMGLQAKELNKLTAALVHHKLIKIYRRNELKEGAMRAVGRQYFYIDYKHFCDVVKWRVAEMRRLIDKDLRNELDTKGYICPQCNQSYTPLDVDRLIDFETGVFLCEICPTELVDNENADNVKGSQDRMQRFNKQMAWVREGLRKSEEMVLPAFDVEKYVRENFTEVDKETEDDGLKIAGGRHAIDEGIGIVIRTDKDEATKKEEREREAEAKRQQNQMPSWHLKSTISGDLTALGIQQQAREAARLQSQAHILDSLTPTTPKTIDGLPSPADPDQKSQQQGLLAGLPLSGMVDVKPTIDHRLDYYDQYYAQLEAGPSQDRSRSGSLEPEEDVKPSISELERGSRKRSRSESPQDEIGGERGSKFLRASMDPLSRSGSASYPPTTGVNTPDINEHPEGGGSGVAHGAGATEDDPLVSVSGIQMRYSEVTEDHHELMTPDEYTAYFEVYQLKTG